MKNILVLSPHPDDEAIGMGGTLRLHSLQGDVVEVIFLTSGELGVKGGEPAATARTREAEAAAAAAVLGYSQWEFWREPDGSLKATASMAERLRGNVRMKRANVIYVPHPQEAHPDHKAAAQLVQMALDGLHNQPEVRLYEVWTPLQDIAHVEDISSVIDAKIAAIRAHQSQCTIMRFDEAALGLARYRGEMHSWPGGPYAEVFGGL